MIGGWTFDPKEAGPTEYMNEDSLFDHEKKYVIFAALEITFSMLTFAVSLALKGEEAMRRGGAEFDAAESKEAGEEVIGRYLPTFLPLVGSFPFWEGVREAANYSGANRRGDVSDPGTREEYELLEPILSARLSTVEMMWTARIPPGARAELERLMRKKRAISKGSKKPRPDRVKESRRTPPGGESKPSTASTRWAHGSAPGRSRVRFRRNKRPPGPGLPHPQGRPGLPAQRPVAADPAAGRSPPRLAQGVAGLGPGRTRAPAVR